MNLYQGRYGSYSMEILYLFLKNKDTLLLERKLDEQKWDTLIKYSEYQLIYNGPNYVGIDPTLTE